MSSIEVFKTILNHRGQGDLMATIVRTERDSFYHFGPDNCPVLKGESHTNLTFKSLPALEALDNACSQCFNKESSWGEQRSHLVAPLRINLYENIKPLDEKFEAILERAEESLKKEPQEQILHLVGLTNRSGAGDADPWSKGTDLMYREMAALKVMGWFRNQETETIINQLKNNLLQEENQEQLYGFYTQAMFQFKNMPSAEHFPSSAKILQLAETLREELLKERKLYLVGCLSLIFDRASEKFQDWNDNEGMLQLLALALYSDKPYDEDEAVLMLAPKPVAEYLRLDGAYCVEAENITPEQLEIVKALFKERIEQGDRVPVSLKESLEIAKIL